MMSPTHDNRPGSAVYCSCTCIDIKFLACRKEQLNLRSCCNAKIYGKTVLNEEIPVNKYEKKINHMSKLVETIFIILKVLKLWVRL